MAVFYKWIKGCQPSAKLENTESKTDAGLWTYLEWGNSNNSSTPGDADSISSTKTYMMPHLKVRLGKNDDLSSTDVKDLGYILTNKMPAPLIQTNFRFNSELHLINSNYRKEDEDFKNQNDTYGLLKHSNNKFIIQGCSGKGGTASSIALNPKTGSDTYEVLKINNYDKRFSDGVDVNAKMTIYDPESASGDVYLLDVRGAMAIGGNATGQNLIATFPKSSENSIVFATSLDIQDHPCHALYFNATSDMRAKENILPATYSALELIQKLTVYTYNYKNHKETVTGIMAQDLLQHQPKELELVSNTNATGDNGDYMSIKNDKLMFVLMKAIQEQQDQIQELQAELKYLKQKI